MFVFLCDSQKATQEKVSALVKEHWIQNASIMVWDAFDAAPDSSPVGSGRRTTRGACSVAAWVFNVLSSATEDLPT